MQSTNGKMIVTSMLKEYVFSSCSTNGMCAMIFGVPSAEAIPVSIPQKYPHPLKRHQYHFRTLEAV